MRLEIRLLEFANEFFLCCFAAFTVFSPLYAYQKMIVLLGFFVLWFITAVAIDPEFWSAVSIPLLLLFAMLFMDVWISLTEGSTDAIILSINKMPNFVWVLVFIFYSRNIELIKRSKWVILGFIVITAVFTLVGNISNPGASRVLAGTVSYYAGERAEYRAMNIGGYDFIYALVFLVLPLITWIQTKKTKMVWMYLMVALFVATVFVSSYTIGIILIVIMVILGLFKTERARGVILVIAASLLVLYFMQDYIYAWMVKLGEMINSDILVQRVTQIFTGEYLEEYGDSNNRLTIYMNALRNWLDRPFFGAMQGGEITYRRSGHSAMFGYLESYGLLACVYFGYFKLSYDRVKGYLYSSIYRTRFTVYYMLAMLFVTIDNFDTFIEIGFMIFFFGPIWFLLADEEQSLIEDADLSEGTQNESFMAYK